MFRPVVILMVICFMGKQAALAWPETRDYEPRLKNALERREELSLIKELLDALEAKRDASTCPEPMYKGTTDWYYKTDIGYGLAQYSNNKLVIQFQDLQETEPKLVDYKETGVSADGLASFFPFTQDFTYDGQNYAVNVGSLSVNDDGEISVDNFCLITKD